MACIQQLIQPIQSDHRSKYHLHYYTNESSIVVAGEVLGGAKIVLLSSSLLLYSVPSTGVYIHGLYLEGAGWDKKHSKLVESSPKIIHQLLPVVHMSATITESTTNKISEMESKEIKVYVYECPVYKKTDRTDSTLIFYMKLNSHKTANHWIGRGVALISNVK
ncbi:hypothetical protein HELRODRAFT_162496 [Helobdella robusta]|uniref:Dynein heavy chain C-terminal domain-containing protein n=1 Tax=Helobdella robusta TaxID=6412 RepID=T1ESR0_HELRO|nr:hypothetical protein HELRODRAFT_162496 [Helobdella robusta]ESN99018.1 hypothetical protein HELRODRAFT_162496 [Helobdella robusta]